jgi:integrase
VRAVRARLADGSTATYWYCRETGARLPDPEADPAAFASAVHAVRKPAPTRWPQGSLGAVIEAWQRSPAYAGLAGSTRRGWDFYLRAVAPAAWSARPITGITRGELLALRDAIAQQRGNGAGNGFHSAISALLAFALDRGEVQHHVLAKARKLPGGHLRPWPDELAQRAMRWTHREGLRRAVVLAYFTGLRAGDLAALRWDQRITYQREDGSTGRALVVMPQKTGKARAKKGLGPLRIPEHPDLSAALDAWQAENARRDTPSLTVLWGRDGRPRTGNQLSAAMLAAVKAESLPAGLNMHGFRKLSASRLAEAGATASEIAAVHGWETLEHVELYTRGADQARLADAAVLRLSSGRRGV